MLILFCVTVVVFMFLRAIPMPPERVDGKEAIRKRMARPDYRACGE